VAVCFLDSSALVKRYVLEAGSSWLATITDPAAGHDLYLARIASVEVNSAVTRRARGGGLTTADAATALGRFRDDFSNQYQIVEISEAVLGLAATLAERHALRAYDAVHLAAVLELHSIRSTMGAPALVLVSSDLELNAAAIVEGLSVDDPSMHL
jgi:predicted nucleic acid-binding protein